MARRIADHFKRRFGNRKFVVVYPDKPVEGGERRFQNEQIAQAFVSVIAGILKREPTADEISGRTDISRKREAE